MKKKILIALVVLAVIPATLFASGFSFGVGAALSYDRSLGDTISSISGDDTEYKFSFEDVHPGVDVKLQFALIDVDVTGFFAKNGTTGQTGIGGLASVNLGFDIFVVRVSAGLGFNWDYNLSQEGKFSLRGTGDTFWESVKNSPINARVAVDVTIGNLGVGIYGSLPTPITIGLGNWVEGGYAIKDAWKAANVGASVVYKF